VRWSSDGRWSCKCKCDTPGSEWRRYARGEVTATAAMRDALLDIISVCDHVHDTFDNAVDTHKAKTPAAMDTGSKK
jgi:hypothetical protein